MPKSFIGQSNLPLGLRNNNPGNLRPYEKWQGQAGTHPANCPNPDQCFIVFKDIAWGLRAMATDLGNDIRRKGLNTIQKLVQEYAPGHENPTHAYIKYVSDSTGIAPAQPIEPTKNNLRKLMRAHLEFENGKAAASLISDADIDEGISLMNSTLLSFFRNAAETVTQAVSSVTGSMSEEVKEAAAAPGEYVKRHPARIVGFSLLFSGVAMILAVLFRKFFL